VASKEPRRLFDSSCEERPFFEDGELFFLIAFKAHMINSPRTLSHSRVREPRKIPSDPWAASAVSATWITITWSGRLSQNEVP
jgi:hypothetical protein